MRRNHLKRSINAYGDEMIGTVAWCQLLSGLRSMGRESPQLLRAFVEVAIQGTAQDRGRARVLLAKLPTPSPKERAEMAALYRQGVEDHKAGRAHRDRLARMFLDILRTEVLGSGGGAARAAA